jgi:hypothetical protein
MHHQILTREQLELLPFISNFSKTFYLVGGTAIALHIGHRRSVDFDLFTQSKLRKNVIHNKLEELPYKKVRLFEDIDQLHLMINGIKITFLSFPYQIDHPVSVEQYIKTPTLLTLSSMKAFALGRRAKWKDYVDLYFILRDYYTIREIRDEADKNFGELFSEKLFREQLAFHKDIDYSEPVDFLKPALSDAEIKQFLIDKAIDINN